MANDRRPHIIYILSDEHRGQAMGHTGDTNLQTPNMDRLAAEGVSFARAYSNCPVCTPSRGTIFSGRHAHAGPIANFFDVYSPSAPSTATILREHGYHTAYFGKWHGGCIRDQVPDVVTENAADYPGAPIRTAENFRAGFQDWFGFEVINDPFKPYVYCGHDEAPTKLEGYQTDALTDLVIDYLKAYDRDEPLFLVLSVEPPHFVCKAPERFHRFDPEQLAVRPNFAKFATCFEGLVPEHDEATLRQILANYYACVENLDWNIGRLTEQLGQLPAFEQTITAYISDHGDFVGSHGMRTTKIQEFEESVRIPAIFHGAGIPAQGLCEGLFSLVDLMATTLELVDVPVPTWNQGSSWAPLLRGEQDFSGPSDVLLEMHGVPRWNPWFADWRGVVNKRWKYAFHENRRESLFDMEQDPYEMNDLASQNPQQCAIMRTRLKELLRETREPYFDVIIDHGVAAEQPNYLSKFDEQRESALRLGGIDVGTD